MAQSLPLNQNELENRSQLHTTAVAHIQTTRNSNRDNQAEPTADQRPFGYGPCRKCNMNKICILFTNCKHLVCCYKCARECSSCLACGQIVIGRLRVFEPN